MVCKWGSDVRFSLWMSDSTLNHCLRLFTCSFITHRHTQMTPSQAFIRKQEMNMGPKYSKLSENNIRKIIFNELHIEAWKNIYIYLGDC